MKDEYPDAKQDLYGAFVVRGIGLAHDAGLLAIVIGDTWMSIKSFEELRLRLLHGHAFDSFVHMRDVSNHPDIFGANAAFVLSMAGNRGRHAPFIRLTPLGSDRKEEDLRVALAQRTPDTGFHLASGADFAAIPGSPIVYWLSEKLLAVFDGVASLGEYSQPREGLTTTDNARFKRAWWEVSLTDMSFGQQAQTPPQGKRWYPMNDGGAYRKWYGNLETVINWENNGEALKAFIVKKVGAHWSKQIRSDRWYLLPSVAVGKITSSEPSFRIYGDGYIPDSAAKFLCVETDSEQLALAGYLNSRTVTDLLSAMAPTLNVTGQALSGLPYQISEALVHGVRSLRETSAADWDSAETSWNFKRNPLLELA